MAYSSYGNNGYAVVDDKGYPSDEELYGTNYANAAHSLDTLPSEILKGLKVHRFSEFAGSGNDILHGDNVPMRKVLGYPIIVMSYKSLPSRFPKRDRDGNLIEEEGTYCKIQFMYIKDPNQNVHVVNTSSNVLQKQLESYKEEIPFATVITTRRNYLTFT